MTLRKGEGDLAAETPTEHDGSDSPRVRTSPAVMSASHGSESGLAAGPEYPAPGRSNMVTV